MADDSKFHERFNTLKSEVGKVLVGQDAMVHRLLLGFVAGGHILLEGVPGLAKTLVIRTLAGCIDATFSRIQFTPDMLPGDVTGTQVFNPKEGSYSVKRGPIFGNLILADEINRAPAKVQAALLEAMQERQVTLGEHTFPLSEPFLVLATQNPIEQEGTYPLPEAQLDRFLLKAKVDYPKKDEERLVLDRMLSGEMPLVSKMLSVAAVRSLERRVRQVYLDERLRDYIVSLVTATRRPKDVGLPDLVHLVSFGASPRATLAFSEASRALAFLRGRGYVVPEDVKEIARDVLRHRILLTYEAEAENVTTETVVERILERVEVP